MRDALAGRTHGGSVDWPEVPGSMISSGAVNIDGAECGVGRLRIP
ncbi:hypothetical protein FTUN_2463 [Frigoriglobus tundricola]|uniref:Uncharacterized protein n=1 Tax=Frigoriglobus tundricola TaxID=2774151 RepID=A0A6M5YLM6_9BACT|nr:hypothetical protein FTUN_2463 [Frigoriglobus tundricola]